MSRAASPPVERICAVEIADGVEAPFEIPDTPIARADGWTIYFLGQPAGVAPVETVIGIEPGVNVYGDNDARRLWKACE